MTDVGELALPADDRVLLPYMEQAGTWEPEERDLLRKLFRSHTRFLDVGANVGYFSLLAAKACPEGAIDAVEPDPRSFELLELNLWAHAPHAQAWPVALGDRRALVSLSCDPNNSGDTRVTSEARAQPAPIAAMMSADELFGRRGFDVVKIDVQGFELEVVLGMRRMIERERRLSMVVEFFPGAIAARGLHPAEVLRTYRELHLERAVCVSGRLERLEDEQILALCAGAGPDGFVNLLLHKN